jgi:hypothetical protein
MKLPRRRFLSLAATATLPGISRIAAAESYPVRPVRMMVGFKARIIDLGGMPLPQSPAEFGKLVADETEKWGKVVKASGAKAN